MSPETDGEDHGHGLSALAEEEAVECPFLLTRWQLAALEAVAHRKGLTVGQMLRHLIQDLCNRPTPPRTDER